MALWRGEDALEGGDERSGDRVDEITETSVGVGGKEFEDDADHDQHRDDSADGVDDLSSAPAAPTWGVGGVRVHTPSWRDWLHGLRRRGLRSLDVVWWVGRNGCASIMWIARIP